MNIVLVVFDTLRKDCTGPYGDAPWGEVFTPHFDAFAQESLVMTRAYPETLPTLPARRAIYTGQRVYPFAEAGTGYKGDNVAMPGWGPIRQDQHTMAEILQAAGWRTSLVSDVFHMFKPSKNFWRGFDQWEFIRGQEMDLVRSGPLPDENEVKFALAPVKEGGHVPMRMANQATMNMRGISREEDYFAPKVFRAASMWVEENRDAENFFLTVESFTPHEYWFVPDHYREMYLKDPERTKRMGTWDDPETMMRGVGPRTLAHYSGLVTMCDRWFGHFMETLRVTGRLDDTLIVFTADHGHTIGDAGSINKRGYQSRPEVFDVPLMVRFPGAENAGTRSDNLVQHHDITAEILKAAGVEPPQPLDGIPFTEAALAGKPGGRNHVTMAWADAVTVVRDNWWMNCKIDGKGALLYDLSADRPFEKSLTAENIELAKEMFELAKQDAGEPYAEYLLERAAKHKNWPDSVDLT